MDGYIRQRLRVAMIHSHPSQRKGHAMKTKWNNEFFVRIGLIPAFWLYYKTQYGHTIADYIEYMKNRQITRQARLEKSAKERGQVYYSPERLQKIQNAKRLARS